MTTMNTARELAELDAEQAALIARRAELTERLKAENDFYNGLDAGKVLEGLRRIFEDTDNLPDDTHSTEGVIGHSDYAEMTPRDFLAALVAPSGDPVHLNTFERLADNDLTLAEVLAAVATSGDGDPVSQELGSVAVADLLDAIPGVGPKGISKALAAAGVEPAEDLSVLSTNEALTITLHVSGPSGRDAYQGLVGDSTDNTETQD